MVPGTGPYVPGTTYLWYWVTVGIIVVPKIFLRTWIKEIISFFHSDFSWYFPVIFVLKWSCFLVPKVPGTDLNGTGYRTFRYLVLPLCTVVHFTCHHPLYSFKLKMLWLSLLHCLCPNIFNQYAHHDFGLRRCPCECCIDNEFCNFSVYHPKVQSFSFLMKCSLYTLNC